MPSDYDVEQSIRTLRGIWELIPTLVSVGNSIAMSTVFSYTVSQIWEHHGVQSPSPNPASQFLPIRQNVARGEVSISAEQMTLYDANIFVASNKASLLDENIVNRSTAHRTIPAMLLNSAYWFFDEVNTSKMIWTSCYIENNVNDSPNDVLLHFLNKTSTRNASLVDVWCEPWDTLYERTTDGATEPKIAVVMQVSFNVTLSAYEYLEVTSCLTLQRVGNESVGHVGYFRPKKPFPSRRRRITPTYSPWTTVESTTVDPTSSTINGDATTVTNPDTTLIPTTIENTTNEPDTTVIETTTTKPKTTTPTETTIENTTEEPDTTVIDTTTTEQETTLPTTIETTTEEATTTTTTKPPVVVVHDTSEYITKYPSVDYNGDFFTIKVFNESETYYGARNICQHFTQTNGSYQFSLVERITQIPSYFDQLAETLATDEDSFTVTPENVDGSYLIWTGAFFNLTYVNPEVLWLPSGEKRLDVSVLSDELCDESKNFKEIIGRVKGKRGAPQRLHVVIKYTRRTASVCLKLLEEGDSYSTLLPACQYDHDPVHMNLVNVVYFPKLTNVSATLSIGKRLCASPLKGGITYPGVLFSADMIVAYDELDVIFQRAAYRSATVWTGGHFNLKINRALGFENVKPHDVLVFEKRDGTFTYRDPSRLRWCPGSQHYVDTLSQLMDYLVEKGYYKALDKLVVPVKINSLGGPRNFCFEVFTEDVLWPGRGAGIVACNLEQKPSLQFNDTYHYQFTFENEEKSLIKSTSNYINNYKRETSCCTAWGSFYIFTVYKLSFEQTSAIVCRDYFRSGLIEHFDKPILKVVNGQVNDKIKLYTINKEAWWAIKLFWTGVFFDVDEISRSNVVRAHFYETGSKIELRDFVLSWCKGYSAEDVRAQVIEIVKNYTNYFTDKGYFPDGPRRINVGIDMRLSESSSQSVEPCLELKYDDLYWPGSLVLAANCHSNASFPCTEQWHF